MWPQHDNNEFHCLIIPLILKSATVKNLRWEKCCYRHNLQDTLIIQILTENICRVDDVKINFSGESREEKQETTHTETVLWSKADRRQQMVSGSIFVIFSFTSVS